MGKSEGLPERLTSEDEACFPNLGKIGYGVRSPKDPTYNCIAFAAGDTANKWDFVGLPLPGYYWPPGAAKGNSIEALRSAYEAIGFEVCAGGALEEGFDKIALYVDNNGDWTHAAKQITTGQWLSKLGDEEDIMHNTEHALVGSAYGQVMYYMRRPSGKSR